MFTSSFQTSHTTQWALHLLAKNPQCQDKIVKEIHDVVGENEDITEENIQRLPYIKAVVKEALRYMYMQIGTL